MEHDKICDPPEKASIAGESESTQDKSWDKWIAKCNELNIVCKLNKAENKLDASDDKPDDEGDSEVKEGCSVGISASEDCAGNETLRDESETTDTKQSGDDAGASVLKRMTTAPELFERTQCHDKVLKKRNTLPASLTKTLLMVGRLHDVAETAIEEKLKYLEINDDKPTDKNEQETPSSDKNPVDTLETCNETKDDVNTLTEENIVNANNEDNKNLTEQALCNAEKESDNDTLQDKDVANVQKDNGSNSDDLQDKQVSEQDAEHKAETIRPESIVRQPTAADIKIQLNDNSVESTTALQEEQNADAAKARAADVAADVTGAEAESEANTGQPCVINVSSCSTATIEPDTELGLPVDENLLFVGDPDTSSLNGFDLAAEPEPKQNIPTDERYCSKANAPL